MADYIGHKLARIGVEPQKVFKPEAYEAMRARLTISQGQGHDARAISLCYPLALNNLAIRALNAAAQEGSSLVTAAIVRDA